MFSVPSGLDRPNSFTSTPREVHYAWSGYSASRALQLPVVRGASARDASLRSIRQYVDTALTALSPQLEAPYGGTGRPSIAPEKLLRTLLLQILYSLRSERLLMEELQYTSCSAGLSAWIWMRRCGT